MTSTTPQTSTAKYGLPLQVKFCKRCTISNQRPNSCIEYAHTAASEKATIAFDAEGVCDACRVAEAKAATNWEAREEELRELCARYRRTDGVYDVLVPGSGGKDSFLAALKMREMGMHPLLVTWAAHLYTDVGWRNLQAWQGLADHYLITPNRRTHALLTRLAVENLFHPFQPFIIGQKAAAPKLAAQLGIQLVMYGENESEYGNPRADANHATRAPAYYTATDIHLSGEPVAKLVQDYGLSHAELQPYMPASAWHLQRAAVKVHYLGYYVRWHPQEAFYAASEHGFSVAPERTAGTYSKYNSLDDKLDDLHYWTTYQKFGIGRATYDTAQEIRSGDITREEGVALVSRYDGEYPERFEREVLEYLSVPGMAPMTRDRLFALAQDFRSPHLWDGEVLRHRVA